MDHYKRSLLNCFAARAIDRAAHKREEADWIKTELTHPGTRFVPLWKTKNLFNESQRPHPVLLTSHDLGDLLGYANLTVFLGRERNGSIFAIDVTRDTDSPPDQLLQFGRFHDLRKYGTLIDDSQSGLLAYARAMIHWHRSHPFCGSCGSLTISKDGGHLRVCSDDQCGREHFPRTDPAIIVLVTSGDQCLLGRQASWAEKFYSTLAGFVEPGESLEEAVAREVFEEAGVRVDEVYYHSSQPWPFPSSVMLGFTAHTSNRTIQILDGELEDARWFNKTEIVSSLKNQALRLPPRLSIAYRLVEDWFDQDHPKPLWDVIKAAGIKPV